MIASLFFSSGGIPQGFAAQPPAQATDAADAFPTRSPIKHVIILIGENRGFDHTFGVYRPKGSGQTISNLLSKGIVNEDGTPGPNYSLAQQYSVLPQTAWYLGAPNSAKMPYSAATNPMPQPNTNGAPEVPNTQFGPFQTTTQASVEADIQPQNVPLLTTGATGLATKSLDTRIPGAGHLAGPFVLEGPEISDDDYTGDTQHRFYSAAQQQDCSIANATPNNPSGCLNDLFPFVMGSFSATDMSQGNSMAFYDAQREQVSLLRILADRYTLSDNYHQAFLGGTGQNHFMLLTGDAAFWSDGNGNATVPPSNLIANPNPQSGTINRYTQDQSFSACADTTQPGVAPIVNYLGQLPYKPQPNCAAGHYYMLNNMNPAFLPNGYNLAANGDTGVLPPSTVLNIGDKLNAKQISWAYFGGSYNDAVELSNAAVAENNPTGFPWGQNLADEPAFTGATYCLICNAFEYSVWYPWYQADGNIKDTSDLLADIQNNTLPAVSIGKPDSNMDGHPQSSKIDLYEAYLQDILTALEANPHLKAETAVFITWDEAGGYYDSGYVQPVDFFGDGPRIPLIAVSPFSTGGKINHDYADAASLLKFIERNWGLSPITSRSRDNLPNPTAQASNPYVPTNSPAIDDLWDMFDFTHGRNSQSFGEDGHRNGRHEGGSHDRYSDNRGDGRDGQSAGNRGDGRDGQSAGNRGDGRDGQSAGN
ncbi:MAG TPA: alkaline phosphatase family protein, partial [Rhodopila sp.]|nr:alkaline phosphatase family protein [Rhodopila sp.]